MVKQESKTVIFCPLNWGLGHATRIVPLIYEYINKGYNIVIAADGLPLIFLKKEFPDLDFIRFKGIKIKYFSGPFLFVGVLMQMPSFLLGFIFEHRRIKQLVLNTNANIIISDNRYGVYCKGVKSIIITHQLFIKTPRFLKIFSRVIHIFTRKLLESFNECWIPDYKSIDRSLSGELSHGNNLPNNVVYINPLSRFSVNKEKRDSSIGEFDVVIVISAPEPYRSLMEKKLVDKHKESGNKILVVCGKPSYNQITTNENNIVKVSHLSDDKMAYVLTNAKKIITHSGYSSIMDMHELGVDNVEWIPTKGQPEQEYLYGWLMRKRIF